MAYALFPAAMTQMARQVGESGVERLRGAGVAAIAGGALLIWLARRLAG